LQHQASVVSAAFSADGTRVITISEDKTAHVWNAANGKSVSSPLPHQEDVVGLAFSADGTCVVTITEGKTARVWDAVTDKPRSASLELQDSVASAAFSADGTHVVTISGNKTARVWNLSLASGTFSEWQAIVDRASPYVLANGVLSPRSTVDDQASSSSPSIPTPSMSLP
jgi:WD40 repeat protein